ncbi:MAG: Replication-associated recombination protein A [candidate division WWE3 bacterium GW2011_GWB2_43_22]|uniref:Replication-associated recombination protein A n=1 Tax=candidate division WWE3 bacterium GW2011_GWB2_43_22 TaxID=1619118 RepID=A0A0G1EPS6_UNCKA|nr:MAG: Replication-associated recombination protein A [candidate division WWE3 bacterium GW2011_GWB2_43_22]
MQPLANKIRPKNLNEMSGHEKLLGEGGIISELLKNTLQTGFFPSLIFWGPPGVGKTTLARIIASETNRKFYEFSAVNTSVKTIEKQLEDNGKNAPSNLWSQNTYSKKKDGVPVVFIDEIHRFNKAQQDALLPLVEQGKIIFMGATTENPSFEVIAPLLSRCRVVIMDQLSEKDLEEIIDRALDDLGKKLEKDARKFLVQCSNGDARTCINVLEIAFHLQTGKEITFDDVKKALQKNQLTFDLQGEEFYNTISALHKSMRGSDPDAALYWLARMLEAGQDPTYIARRLTRFASEDIGIKDPQALVIAVAAFQACERIGMPECALALAEAVVYFAKSPKSNELYIAYGKAADDVMKYGNLPVPMHIRNAPTKLMKDVGYGKNYNYYHSPEGKKLPDIEYFPDKLKGTKYLR